MQRDHERSRIRSDHDTGLYRGVRDLSPNDPIALQTQNNGHPLASLPSLDVDEVKSFLEIPPLTHHTRILPIGHLLSFKMCENNDVLSQMAPETDCEDGS
jgi:hypothetical protein